MNDTDEIVLPGSDEVPFTQKFLNRTPLDDFRLLSGDYWGELRVFLAVAKAGSYNRAAELLTMSQPTVARQVKRLQDVMRAQLVVSSSSGVNLTERGKQLAAHLAALDRSLSSLSADMKAEDKNLGGLVRVSITEGLGLLFLIPELRRMAFESPGIQVDIQSPLNLNDLRKNQTDMMLGFFPAVSQDVTCRKLGVLHLSPVASRDYVEQYGVPTLNNLHEHRFIQSSMYQSEAPIWGPWNGLVSAGRVTHSADNPYAYAMLVKAGLGIGLLGNFTMLDPRALPLDLGGVHVPLRLFACALTERLDAKPARIMFDRLSKLFGAATPWFAEERTLTPMTSIADEGMEIIHNSMWRVP